MDLRQLIYYMDIVAVAVAALVLLLIIVLTSVGIWVYGRRPAGLTSAGLTSVGVSLADNETGPGKIRLRGEAHGDSSHSCLPRNITRLNRARPCVAAGLWDVYPAAWTEAKSAELEGSPRRTLTAQACARACENDPRCQLWVNNPREYCRLYSAVPGAVIANTQNAVGIRR